jgi:hypothetical protein
MKSELESLERRIRFCGHGAMVCVIIAAILVCLCLARAARAQEVLLPCYEPVVGQLALAQVPKGKESKLWLLLNVNSGPGIKRDAVYGSLAKAARARGVKLAYYIDLKGGGDYSPVIVKNGDAWKLITSPVVRLKSALELKTERDAWRVMYDAPQAWFIDDVPAKLSPDLINELCGWGPKLILNPGCQWTPPPLLVSAVVVISEQAKEWPRTLSGWEASHRSQCAVMGLSVNSQALPAFMASTRGLAFRYASPLDDQWCNGKSAYNTLPTYFTQLFP